MKKYFLILVSLLLAVLCACNFLPVNVTSVLSTENVSSGVTQVQVRTPSKAENEFPAHNFSAVMVGGVNSKDIVAFSKAMAENGWEPVTNCMGNYCDVGTNEHYKKGATFVFFSGHGYVDGSRGFFNYADLSQSLHTKVDRSIGRTDSYQYDGMNIWTETEYYCDMVENQQTQGLTDWIILAACNQLNLNTRGSIIDAMNTPSERPLKGVFSYNNLSGGNMDDYITAKFVQLCMNEGGQGKVAYAWFASHYLFAPFLTLRARAALRQGFQYGTLTSQMATAQDVNNEIKFWKFEENGNPMKYTENDKQTIIGEILLNNTQNTTIISKMNTEIADPGNIELSKQQAADDVLRDARIPDDFKYYKTGCIIEMDDDGSNEKTVAALHTFARYVDNIRVSIDPTHGEYLNVVVDGTDKAEIDLVTYIPTHINLDDSNVVKKINRNKLISKDEIIDIGLKAIKRVQEDKKGYYEDSKVKTAELVYVISPSSEDKLVLAWEIMDNNYAHATVDALNGSVLYWST